VEGCVELVVVSGRVLVVLDVVVTTTVSQHRITWLFSWRL
jgi:hypothetical protein